MNIIIKLVIIVCLLGAIGFVVANKDHSAPCEGAASDKQSTCSSCSGCPSKGTCLKEVVEEATAPPGLPSMIDFGRNECIPCKMMEPVLESLKENYADKFAVSFVNTELDPETTQKYGVTSIPTQIFFNADGKEIYRNVGFIAEYKILAKWEELGIAVD